MAELTTAQEGLLARVDATDAQWRAIKLSARETARKAAEKEVEQYLVLRDMAVRAAFSGGVPKAQIGVGGLKSSSPSAVADSLGRTSGLVDAVVTAGPVSEWAQYVEYVPDLADPDLSRMWVTCPTTGERVPRTVTGQHPWQPGVEQPKHSVAYDAWFDKNWVALVAYMKELTK